MLQYEYSCFPNKQQFNPATFFCIKFQKIFSVFGRRSNMFLHSTCMSITKFQAKMHEKKKFFSFYKNFIKRTEIEENFHTG